MMKTHSETCGRRWTARLTCGRAGSRETGTALVELALTLPLLVVLLAGAAQYGRLAYLAIEVANAARAGAAYGAQNHATASDTGVNGGMVLAAKNDATDVTGTDVTTALSATASNLCACSNALASTSACSSTFSCSGTNRIVEYVQVKTSAGRNVPDLRPRSFKNIHVEWSSHLEGRPVISPKAAVGRKLSRG